MSPPMLLGCLMLGIGVFPDTVAGRRIREAPELEAMMDDAGSNSEAEESTAKRKRRYRDEDYPFASFLFGHDREEVDPDSEQQLHQQEQDDIEQDRSPDAPEEDQPETEQGAVGEQETEKQENATVEDAESEEERRARIEALKERTRKAALEQERRRKVAEEKAEKQRLFLETGNFSEGEIWRWARDHLGEDSGGQWVAYEKQYWVEDEGDESEDSGRMETMLMPVLVTKVAYQTDKDLNPIVDDIFYTVAYDFDSEEGALRERSTVPQRLSVLPADWDKDGKPEWIEKYLEHKAAKARLLRERAQAKAKREAEQAAKEQAAREQAAREQAKAEEQAKQPEQEPGPAEPTESTESQEAPDSTQPTEPTQSRQSRQSKTKRKWR